MKSKPKKILISYDDFPPIALYLAKEFEVHSVETNVFITNKTEHWLNHHLFRKINKFARTFRLVSKGADLFAWSSFSYTKYLKNEFAKRIKQFKPDLIFCIHGQRFDVELLSQLDIPKIGWWVEPDPNKESLLRFARPFDLYLSYDSEVVDFLNTQGVQSEYQSHVSSPLQFFPIPNTKKAVDILFFGNWSPWREEVLYAALQITKNIALYGNSWKNKCKLFSKSQLIGILKGKEILDTNLNKAINSSHIVLNAQRLRGLSSGLDTRFFDVLASGNLLVTDAPKDLGRQFVDKQHLLVYRDINQLITILKEVLQENSNAQEISRLGKEQVLKNYTYTKLAQNVITRFNLQSG